MHHVYEHKNRVHYMSKRSMPHWCHDSESVHSFVISIPHDALSTTKLSNMMIIGLALTTDNHNIRLPPTIQSSNHSSTTNSCYFKTMETTKTFKQNVFSVISCHRSAGFISRAKCKKETVDTIQIKYSSTHHFHSITSIAVILSEL